MKPRAQRITPDPLSSFSCNTRRDAGFGFLYHIHPEYELTLITQSRGKRFVGDAIGDYEEGDLVLLGSNLPHTWYSEAGHPKRKHSHQAIYAQFTEDFLGEVTSDILSGEAQHRPSL